MQSFEIQAWNTTDGWDASNVPCKIVSVNAMLGFSLRNPSKLFGMHVHPGPIALHVLQRSIAYGKVLLCQKHTPEIRKAILKSHISVLHFLSLHLLLPQQHCKMVCSIFRSIHNTFVTGSSELSK